MYMYTPVYTCLYTNVYIYTCIYMYTHICVYMKRPRLAAEDLKFFELAAKDAYGTMKFLIFMQ